MANDLNGLTNRRLITELGKPGKVYMPVMVANDVVYLAVEKAYLIDLLKQQEPDEPAWWRFYGDPNGTERWLDVQ
jgi:hypothetical protein